ncbi:MAG TPA: YicC/YloC family endoribonuclease [Clostridia bacterium]|nr:YicC/YloC family endoribonuclease [Clostridia bacterium]
MTGYGKGVAEGYDRKVTIEMKAVNHRALDLVIKLPRGLAFCEDSLRKILSSYFYRGHIELYCNYEDKRQNKEKVIVDKDLVTQFLNLSKEIEALGFANDMSVSQVLQMPDVLKIEKEADNEDIVSGIILSALNEACQNLLKMRQHEGEMLYQDINARFDNLESTVKSIEERAPLVGQIYAQKLTERIQEALKEVGLDEARLYNEVAFFIDRSNIDEEIARLKGHIEHGRNIMAKEGSIGESLDFLMQELMREANTTGSKSNDLELTRYVLDAKNEIKKIKEQVQNIE